MLGIYEKSRHLHLSIAMGLTQCVWIHIRSMSSICVRIVKGVLGIVHNARHLGHDDSSECITANIDHSTEAVQKPVDSYDNSVHPSNRNVDGAYCR
jgi:hypothetical protein